MPAETGQMPAEEEQLPGEEEQPPAEVKEPAEEEQMPAEEEQTSAEEVQQPAEGEKPAGEEAVSGSSAESVSPGTQEEKAGPLELQSEEPAQSGTEQAPVDNSTTLADGNYVLGEGQFSYSGGTGKVKITCGGVRVAGGKAYGIIQFSSKNYTRIKVGCIEYEMSVVDGKAQAEVPVKINGITDISGYTTAMSDPHWVDYQITISISEDTGNDKEDNDKPGDNKPGDNKPGDEKPGASMLKDGKYSIGVDSSAAMFRVTDCTLTVKSKKISAVITLSGTGYGYLYLGTAVEAAGAARSEWIPFAADKNGKYTYTLNLESIDAPIAVAAYSTKNKVWYDRTLTFKKDTLISLGGENQGSNTGNQGGSTGNAGNQGSSTGSTGNQGGSTGNTGSGTGNQGGGTGSNNSSWSATVGGSTAGVNSSTNLADGTYTPDQFSFSGGTGRVFISCPKVVVRGGQAYATIVFGSGAYSYVKADGSTYYGVNTAGTSTFEIPVQLNQNNTIIGCTTRMSAAHEIIYSIFVYIEGASGGDASEQAAAGKLSATELSKEAPKIAGLTFAEETKAEEAEYYKIFKYEGGITCIEIDLGVDIDKDLKLYGKEILRYLVVPYDAEIPAGLDKEMVVIRQPDKESGESFHAYVASRDALQWMDDMGQLENIALLGMKEEECETENVQKLFQDKKITFGGTYNNMKYKAFVKAKCDLAVMPAEILPAKDGEADLEKYIEAAEYLDELDIPLFVDRSSLEKTKKGRNEWIKVYGIIFGCEDEADALCQAETEEG